MIRTIVNLIDNDGERYLKVVMQLELLLYLQSLVEIGSENSTTIVFPMPIDLLKGIFEKKLDGKALL